MSIVKPEDFVFDQETYDKYHKTPKEMKRKGGTIENWCLVDWYNDGKTFVISGDIYGDMFWPEGEDLRTSFLVNLDLVNREAETLNTIYKLGKELSLSQ